MDIISASYKLFFGSFRLPFRYFFFPIDYTRTVEIPQILKASGIKTDERKGLRILDISSPQILTICLAQSQPDAEIIYINPFEDELEDMYVKKHVSGCKNIQVLKGDITQEEDLRKLGKFDYIFSCSVFEHIYPEENGDIVAIKNIPGLLQPGGSFTASVPFYSKGFNEYKRTDVYATKNTENAPIFFQRFYDPVTIQERLLAPSGLNTKSMVYAGEKFYQTGTIQKRLGMFFAPFWKKVLFGKFFGLISKLFMEYSENSTTLKKPYLAIFCLNNEH